ncbi:MAG: hypothetical protein SFY96_00785 [Planctomycetota bacterium]|nr:hypothetical protein [Planctomycetota bacterium]
MIMNRLQTGPLQIACVALVAAAGWRFGLRPLEAKALQLRAEADSAERELRAAETAGELTPPDADLVARVKQADAQVRELATRSTQASRLHEELSRVAQECGVRIASLEPRGRGTPVATNGDLRIANAPWVAEATGSFEGVTRLLDVLEDRVPLSRVQGFRLTGGGPTPGAAETAVSIEFTSFQVSSADENAAKSKQATGTNDKGATR